MNPDPTDNTPSERQPPPAWSLDRSELLHESPWFSVRQDHVTLANGVSRVFTYIDNPGAVVVVPVLSDGRIALVRVYRHTTNSWSLEAPAGSLGDKPALAAEDVAREELLEELGGVCTQLEPLGQYHIANGFARYQPRFYLARGVLIVAEPAPESGEIIRDRVCVTPEEARRLALDGEISDGESAFAVLLAFERLRLTR